MQEFVSSRVLEGLAGLVENYGQSADSIAASVGLDPVFLQRPDLLVDVISVNDMIEEAAQVCGDRFFSLKLARLQGWDILGPLWLAVRKARTVREALQLLADNLELHSRALSAYLVKESSGFSFCWEVRKMMTTFRPKHTATVQVEELGLAVCCLEIRRLLGDSWRPDYVQFRHARPEQQAPLRQIFGERVFFNQDQNALHLTEEDCLRPVNLKARADPNTLEREMQSTLGAGMPFTLRVDRIIRQLINGEECTVNKVADALNVKPRTLQYRLKQNQTSYQALYDAARLDLARHYLKKSDLSIAAVSERLHFKDCAAFSRFFKARIGNTPRAYAKRARGAQ